MRRRARQRVPRRTRCGARRSDRACGGGSSRGQTRRTFSSRRVADRFRHAIQHGRERSDREPRHRDAGRRARLEEADSSQRSRQQEPVVERLLSDGDAHRHRARNPSCSAAGIAGAAESAGGESGGVCRCRENRTYAFHGRDTGYTWAGILRLYHAGRERHRPREIGAAATSPTGTGRHGGRNGLECARSLCRIIRGGDRADNEASVRQRA